MEDVNVIKLPVTKEKKAAKKRPRPPKLNPEEEEDKRQSNAKRLAVLGEEDTSVKLLEQLVFGAEEELLERLVEVMFSPDLIQKSANLMFSYKLPGVCVSEIKMRQLITVICCFCQNRLANFLSATL